MMSAAEIRMKYKEKDDGQTGVLRRTRCHLSFLPLIRITAAYLLIDVGGVSRSRVRIGSIETISD